MPDFGDFDKHIGPTHPIRPSRRPEPRKKPRSLGQHRETPEDSRSHIDDYA